MNFFLQNFNLDNDHNTHYTAANCYLTAANELKKAKYPVLDMTLNCSGV